MPKKKVKRMAKRHISGGGSVRPAGGLAAWDNYGALADDDTLVITATLDPVPSMDYLTWLWYSINGEGFRRGPTPNSDPDYSSVDAINWGVVAFTPGDVVQSYMTCTTATGELLCTSGIVTTEFEP